MLSVLKRVRDDGFGVPRGVLGRLGGAIMARGNVEQEQWAVREAELRIGDRVLVVGHGPGVGVGYAAEAVGPEGAVFAVDPSATMRDMATARCASAIAEGVVEIRDGTAEQTGRADASVDTVISVNNVMLWDRVAGFAELHRVLRPGGRLVITVHQHVLGCEPAELSRDAGLAGFVDLTVNLRPRRLNSPAVEVLAARDHA